jgi:hypothetical protein
VHGLQLHQLLYLSFQGLFAFYADRNLDVGDMQDKRRSGKIGEREVLAVNSSGRKLRGLDDIGGKDGTGKDSLASQSEKDDESCRLQLFFAR